MIIVWDGRENVKVEVPVDYWNNTCGLCGTFDGDITNEYLDSNGVLVSYVIFFSFHVLPKILLFML